MTPSPLVRFSVFVTFAAALGPAGCGDRRPISDTGPIDGGPDGGGSPTRVVDSLVLEPISGCDQVGEAIRQKAIEDMHARLEASLTRALTSHRSPCAYDAGWGGMGGAVSAAGGSGGGASSYSTTNNQVASVDEADFIKNDGQYIYAATARDFRVVEAWPPTTARTLARVAIEGQPRSVLFLGDRAVVFSALGAASAAPPPCTYGYGCDFTGDGRPTKITVLDISDRAAPVVVREIRSSSSYLTARRIDTAVHAVLVTLPESDPIPTWPTTVAICGGKLTDAQIRAEFDELRENNEAIIAAGDVTNLLPSIVDIRHNPDGTTTTSSDLLAGCSNFYRETGPSGDALTTVLSFDIAEDTARSAATILSRPGAVYVATDALYMSVPHDTAAERFSYSAISAAQLSTVHKLRLRNAPSPASAFAGSGVVKGRVLNQFSMDEYQGHLRIATTSGYTPDPAVHSTLTVLAESNGALIETGAVDQIAPTEDIRAVRFDGDRGYVVTFKKTDPLFVFDLADPTAPAIRGELKIPGFSTYIHRMDDTHLLTVGYDAEDHDTFAYFTGVLLQIFDVADATNPQLTASHVIGTRGSSSEALGNHLAFNYFPPANLLLLPMTICVVPDGGSIFGSVPTFSGLMAFDASVAGGIQEHGRVTYPVGPGATCGNWWTSPSSLVRRSIVMDDYVFSITDAEIKASPLADLTQETAVVSLTD